MKKKEISLRKWLKGYWLGIGLLLVLVYFLAQTYLFRMLTNRAEQNIQSSIFIASNGIEDSLEIVDSFIYEALYSGSGQSTSQLYRSLKDETDPVLLATTKNTVVSSLINITTWSDMIGFILLYTDRPDGAAWLEAGNADNYQGRREVRQFIADSFENHEVENLGRYMICTGYQHNYMLRMMKIEGSYLVVGVSEQAILSTLQNAAYDGNSISFAAQASGDVIFSTRELEGRFLPEQEGTYVKVGEEEYLQTGYVSDKTGYYFGSLTNRSSIAEDMWVYRLIFAVMFLVLLFLVPASLYLIYRYVQRPIESLSATMNQIAEGELDIIVEEEPQISELLQLVRAFNHMIERIKKLKIEKYEGKLETQRATMQYLQMQIKPHFYANVLNIIYSLAERKDYETIQRISKAIVHYSRYMFHDASELVELQREIEHVHNYMEIQEIRYMLQITCEFNVPEALQGALIPPFIIQSFVENSMKYAFSTKRNCQIQVHVETDAAKEYVYLTIRDNGEGYSEELLQLDWNQINEEGHIGLTNVYKRLKLVYDDKASIELYNDQGAVVRIRIPYIAIDNMEFE